MDEMIYRQELRENVFRCPFLTQLNGKKILITGGTGLIGKELVDTLAEYEEQNHTGIEIYVMSRNGKGIEKRFPDLVKREWFHYLEQDVSMPLFIDAPIEYILHCAGKGDPKSMTEDPVGILDANIIGTKQILQFAARQKNSRVLYLSSGEVYGILSTVDSKGIIESDCGELDPLNVRNCYGIAKRAGESMCASFLSEYGVDVRIARPAHIYGMTAMENESRVVFQFLKRAAQGKDIILKVQGYKNDPGPIWRMQLLEYWLFSSLERGEKPTMFLIRQLPAAFVSWQK